MSAISQDSDYAKRLNAQLRVDNLNRTVENGYRWYVNDFPLSIEKRAINSNSVTQTIPIQSANTFDSQNPVLWFVVALVVFVLFKVSANQ
jgi:hypothetical protein